MAKFQVLLLIAACVLAIAEAQQVKRQLQRSASQRLSRGRSRYSARQELAADADAAVTPYPSADELKPEVPFDEAAAPAAIEPTPDAVYGPPDALPAPNNVPDEVYGPPDVTGNDLPAADVPAEQARLVAARRQAAKLRRAQPVAYRRAVAVASAVARPAKLSAVSRRF